MNIYYGVLFVLMSVLVRCRQDIDLDDDIMKAETTEEQSTELDDVRYEKNDVEKLKRVKRSPDPDPRKGGGGGKGSGSKGSSSGKRPSQHKEGGSGSSSSSGSRNSSSSGGSGGNPYGEYANQTEYREYVNSGRGHHGYDIKQPLFVLITVSFTLLYYGY